MAASLLTCLTMFRGRNLPRECFEDDDGTVNDIYLQFNKTNPTSNRKQKNSASQKENVSDKKKKPNPKSRQTPRSSRSTQ